MRYGVGAELEAGARHCGRCHNPFLSGMCCQCECHARAREAGKRLRGGSR